jgi:hypothetical protein
LQRHLARNQASMPPTLSRADRLPPDSGLQSGEVGDASRLAVYTLCRRDGAAWGKAGRCTCAFLQLPQEISPHMFDECLTGREAMVSLRLGKNKEHREAWRRGAVWLPLG